MTTYLRFVSYDTRRHIFIQEFEAASDEAARSEFSWFYRARIGGAWEHREFGRYVLLHVGFLTDGVPSSLPDPRIVMLDDEVRLDYERFMLADPPETPAAEAEAEAEFARLDALDAERLARKANVIREMVSAANASV